MIKLFRFSGVLRQLLAVLAGDLAMLAGGIVMAWSSPALPKMSLTPSQGSWAGSLPSLGAAVGPWLGGWLSDRLGRKATVMLGAAPIVLSWVALIFCEYEPVWLCVVRFVSGLGVGLIFAAMPTYVGEIAQADVRGALSSLIQVSMTTGFMIDYCVGPFVSYTTLAIIGMVTPLVAVACFAWMPESPYYLLAVGKDAAAEKSLRWLRDPDRDVMSELRQMKKAVEESKLNEPSVLDLFRSRRCRRALAISLGVVCSEQIQGINAVLFYSQSIFIAAGGSVSDIVAPMIINGTMLVESCFAPFLVDRVGRRRLLLFSSTGMCLALIPLGVFFVLSDAKQDVESIGWIPVTALIFYIIVYTPGYGCLPFTVSGEVFPPNVKIVAMPMAACVSWFMSFIVTRFYEDIALAVGNGGPFFVFAGCALLVTIYVYFVVPETKGKTLEEIQEMLGE
ncbi:facilitated trehalose transporter Tret1-like [Schistocerca serialis cubense]|uniref:facilitated trehalose transporter Tret1-like n=1 Tax=Schistocerca serialis cubense TaxID=2023355 RepID=UPI00214E59B2|nr:facilitated trehalose transporter Tret1-like [Schistocerca serialis cubense]